MKAVGNKIIDVPHESSPHMDCEKIRRKWSRPRLDRAGNGTVENVLVFIDCAVGDFVGEKEKKIQITWQSEVASSSL